MKCQIRGTVASLTHLWVSCGKEVRLGWDRG